MKTTTEQRDIIERLLAVWLAHPHQRLGQLISNGTALHDHRMDAFFIEDSDLIEALEAWRHG